QIAEFSGGLDVALDVHIAEDVALDERELCRRQQHASQRAHRFEHNREPGLCGGSVDRTVPEPYGKTTRRYGTEHVLEYRTRSPERPVVFPFGRRVRVRLLRMERLLTLSHNSSRSQRGLSRVY